VSSLKLNSLDLKLRKSYYFIFTFGLIASIRRGSAGCTLLPLARSGKIRVHGSTWQHAQNMVVCINAMT